MLTYDLDSRKLVDRYVQRINPQRAIDPGAQAVHGITFADVATCPVWDDVAGEVAKRLAASDLCVAHNANFDAPFIGMELIRIGRAVPDVKFLCTMEEGRWATPLGKFPNLGELCFALGVPYDKSKAHGAEYDTSITAECFFLGLDYGFYKLPATEALKLAA